MCAPGHAEWGVCLLLEQVVGLTDTRQTAVCDESCRVVSRASRSTSVLGGKERLVTFARYSWALPECWQSQSDCTAANYDVTSHGLPY